jgi:hypothetical protein
VQRKQAKESLKGESLEQSMPSTKERDLIGVQMMKNYYYKQDYLSEDPEYRYLNTEQKVNKLLEESIFKWTGAKFFLNEYSTSKRKVPRVLPNQGNNFFRNLAKQALLSEKLTK